MMTLMAWVWDEGRKGGQCGGGKDTETETETRNREPETEEVVSGKREVLSGRWSWMKGAEVRR